ncbi:ABC transporter ATP-binding protein [Thermaerobacter subterraneus]|uniref:ABC-type multidrug transport system, ATPase component n=1 Tax=Thermaerobacter subterraneus DSM 13965 TaxID=867903 RepID=K6PZW6_9FIRM|nr:ABC transporter ATP-binding protein [Thermaerobacter subterraneus]EKP94358.1 ABC-type multidrug transport system, ATPase component [Thermaerobacter subterraneus DSM 13965]
MIEVSRVSKRFGEHRAVTDLTFTVQRGEIVGLLGPNGAGKTTTMRLITGYMPPSAGTIRVAGFDTWEEPLEVKRRVGYLPENPPVYPDMTVESYLLFVAALKGVPRPRRRAEAQEAAERTGVAHVWKRLIGNLSRGYRQRVGLAQALVGKPDVLILDEPTVGLDPAQIVEVRQLIRDLAGEHTVILSSHILPEVRQTCQRVLIMNRGRLVAQDTPEGLTRALQGGTALQLAVKGPAEAVARRLRELDGVEAVRLLEPGPRTAAPAPAGAGAAPGDRTGPEPEAVVRLEVTARGRDVREPIFYAMAAERWPILEMRPLEMTLEEIFMQLVTDEPAPSAPGEQGRGGAAAGDRRGRRPAAGAARR